MGNTDNEAVEAARKLGILGGSSLTSFVEGWNAAYSKKPTTGNIPTARSIASGQAEAQRMIEFAKFHVEAALKAAAEKATISEGTGWNGRDHDIVDKESILTAYPPENIR